MCDCNGACGGLGCDVVGLAGVPGFSGYYLGDTTVTPPQQSGYTDQIKQSLLQAAFNWLTSAFSAHPLDAERLKQDYEAFRLALGGDVNALAFLKQRSGRYGVAVVQGYENNTPIGGWATDTAQNDAYLKYTQVFQCQNTGACPTPSVTPTQGDVPTYAEVQAKLALLRQNRPIGADGLRWVDLGYITQTDVAQAFQMYGNALYAAGGALDPLQRSSTQFGGTGSLQLSNTMLLALGAGVLVLLVAMNSGGKRGRR